MLVSLCQCLMAAVVAVLVTCYATRPRFDAVRLRVAEHIMLAHALNASSQLSWHQQQVPIPDGRGSVINTVIVRRRDADHIRDAADTSRPRRRRRLVMLHGWCGAVGYWVRNFEGLLDAYDEVYALDLLGWGRSSRPPVDAVQSALEAQQFWTGSVEMWREAVGLDGPFELLGHSLGTYVAASYAATHPARVARLVLAAPIGIEPNAYPAGKGLLGRLLYRLQWTAGLTLPMLVRALGPFGPPLVWKATGGDAPVGTGPAGWLAAVCGHAHREHVFEYTVQLLLAPSSGDRVTERLKNPAHGYLLPIYDNFVRDLSMPVTLIYGEHDHVAVNVLRDEVLRALPHPDSRVVEMPGVTHQLYMERPDAFNKLVAGP